MDKSTKVYLKVSHKISIWTYVLVTQGIPETTRFIPPRMMEVELT